ncbi:MAG: hypothetical protein WDM90_02980 [Ferruginibacter sp.]
MKKLFFAIILCITIILSAQAQTKEETITWLKEKLDKYLILNERTHNFVVTVTSCEIIFSYTYDLTYNGREVATTGNFKTIIPTDQTIFEINKISTKGDRIIEINLNTQKKDFMQETSWFIIKEAELDLRARANKALAHLATFCPKKEETF